VGNKSNAAAIFSAAMIVTIPWLATDEGESLTAYRDYAGVWTACHGDTIGVKQGDIFTPKQCKEMLKSRTGQFMTAVYNMLNIEISPEILASHTHFAYNIGLAGYKKSKTLELTNNLHFAEGCQAMMNWYKSDGHDCRMDKGKKNGCYGLILRRQGEVKKCMEGVPKG
jgi:lysozyme